MIDAATWKDALVTCAAVGGLVLGIINTTITVRARLPRVRLTAVDVPKGSVRLFGIEVVNLSTFPVTVVEIGFARAERFERLRGLLRPSEVRVSRAPIRSLTEDGKPLPVRLAPGEAAVLTGDAEQWLGLDMPLRRVYAKLNTGSISYGRGPALDRARRANQAVLSP